jgi:hypothetical protein
MFVKFLETSGQKFGENIYRRVESESWNPDTPELKGNPWAVACLSGIQGNRQLNNQS